MTRGIGVAGRPKLPGSHPLPAAHDSLALGVPAAGPGTIFALAFRGGIEVRSKEGRTILFGRNQDNVHVCIGADDPRVSRNHGALTHRDGKWWVSNTGQVPIRVSGERLLYRDEEPIPLDEGYSPLFVPGSNNRQHLLEVYVTGPDRPRPGPRFADPTVPPRRWPLSDRERLALIVLGQRYLLHESRPQPLAWEQAAGRLRELQPAVGWTAKQVERTVGAVRTRLSKAGVAALTREEVGEPVGNSLNDNLLRELLMSTTLVPTDLALIDEEGRTGHGFAAPR